MSYQHMPQSYQIDCVYFMCIADLEFEAGELCARLAGSQQGNLHD